ncbi:putative cold-regulated 413 protein [Arabidopsis thaliana]
MFCTPQINWCLFADSLELPSATILLTVVTPNFLVEIVRDKLRDKGSVCLFTSMYFLSSHTKACGFFMVGRNSVLHQILETFRLRNYKDVLLFNFSVLMILFAFTFEEKTKKKKSLLIFRGGHFGLTSGLV